MPELMPFLDDALLASSSCVWPNDNESCYFYCSSVSSTYNSILPALATDSICLWISSFSNGELELLIASLFLIDTGELI
jgi:hypothetical protein